MKSLIIFILVLLPVFILGQSFSINTDGSTADASAILDVKSDAKGLLLPRMNMAQKNAITSPATGLLVFQTAPDSIGFHYFNGSQWLWLDPFVNNAWKTTGNAGTDTSVNYIGTNDAMPLRFKQNSQQIALWDRNNQNYSIGANALRDVTTGSFNTGIGNFAGSLNRAGLRNTFIGALTDFGTGIDSLVNATAIGYAAKVDTSNALILGNNVNVGIGTSKPRFKMHVAKGNSGNLTGSTSRIAVFEDDLSAYIQLLNPNVNESGIFAGNASTLVKSGLIFQADSSITLRSGGNFNRVLIANNGNVGIANTAPQSRLHVSRGTTASAVFHPSASAIFEASSSHLLQIMNPSTSIGGIISGTELTNMRSSIFFNADSSVSVNSPGSIPRLTAKNNGVIHIPYRVGINNQDPQSRLHINNGSVSGAVYHPSASAIIESSFSHFLQLMNPSTSIAGVISGTDLSNIRSSIFFNADSSVSVNSPGSTARLRIFNDGDVSVSSRFAVGINDPQARLHISNGITAGAVYIPGVNSIFESASSNFIHFMNPATANASILSGSDAVNVRSAVNFNADSSITLATGGFSTRMTITKTGATGINTITPAATFDANGTFKLGNAGTVNNALIKAIPVVNVGSIAANSELDEIVPVTNASTAGAVNISPMSDLPAGIIISWARVSSAGNVTIRFRNVTGSAIDPPSMNYVITVVQ